MKREISEIEAKRVEQHQEMTDDQVVQGLFTWQKGCISCAADLLTLSQATESAGPGQLQRGTPCARSSTQTRARSYAGQVGDGACI